MSNLNIQDYTIQELMEIFSLKSGFDEEDIDQSLIELLQNYTKLGETKYITFLKEAREKLLEYVESHTHDEKENEDEDESYEETHVCNEHNNEVENTDGQMETLPNQVLPSNALLQENSNYLIDPKFSSPTSTHENVYPHAVLNPIHKQTVKSIISIDTLFREDTYKSNDFIYNLNTPLKNVVSMKLLSCELPNVWYSYSAENNSNVFYIDMFKMNDGTGTFFNQSYTIELPAGNYTPVQFKKLINNIFTNISANNGPGFLTVDINEYTGQVIIRANNTLSASDLGPDPYDATSPYYSPDFYYTLRFAYEGDPNRPLYLNAGWMMGFRDTTYTVVESNQFTNNTITPSITYKAYIQSEGYYGCGISTYVFLEIDDFNKNFKNAFISSNDRQYLMDNVLGRISLTSGSNTVVVNTAGDDIYKQRDYFGPVSIDKLRIRLINKYGALIDINNNNFSFSLEITQLY